MASELPSRPPKIGEMVQVRSRRWLVEQVVPSDAPGESHLVSLACADDDAQGQSLDVFWNYEIDRRILEEEHWHDLGARGFDVPRQFAAFLHTLRWNCVTATDPNLFQAPFRAGIKIDAYQMEPLRKALRLPRVNLFIADDTGLGKTIEAGLIARELLLRKKAKTIVVAAPPSVLEQWKAELEARFGLLFEILDRAYLTRIRRERGFGVNPWRTHSRFLVSHNLLIDPVYGDPMREWLGQMLPGSLKAADQMRDIVSPALRQMQEMHGRFLLYPREPRECPRVIEWTERGTSGGGCWFPVELCIKAAARQDYYATRCGPNPDHGNGLARRSPAHQWPSRPRRVSPPRRFSHQR